VRRPRTSLLPAALVCALLAALVPATSASAEVRVGEATQPATPGAEPEADVLAAHAEYDSSTGFVVFKVTTAAAPQTVDPAGEESEAEMETALFSPAACNLRSIEHSDFPQFFLNSQYEEGGRTFWQVEESEESDPEPPDTEGPATKASAGTTTTLSATVPQIANQAFSCAGATVVDPGSPTQGKPLVFPIAVPPPPPPPAETTITPPALTQTVAPPSPGPVPGPAPTVLSIARSKPLTLKPGRWTTVKIKVTDASGPASEPGTLRLQVPKGVTAKPRTQRLPGLPAGGSWTVSARVRLTGKAKAKSTIALTATAGATTATGSLAQKSQD
jgi:hypothetical protein